MTMLERPPSIMRQLDRARPRGQRPPERQPVPSVAVSDSQFWADLLGLTDAKKVFVDEKSVRGLPAIGAGVDMVAHAVATMMVGADVFDAAGNKVDTPLVVSRPNVLWGSFEWWYNLVGSVMMRGNHLSICADFDVDGWPRQQVPIHWDMVHVHDETGLPFYEVNGVMHRFDEVAHVRHGAPVGSFTGLGIVERYRCTLSEQLHQQRYGERSFSTGGVPSAVVTLDTDKVKAETAQQVKDDWVDKLGHAQRSVAVVPRTMKVQPLSWSPEDAQFIEAKQLSVAEAALLCGLDPADLGASIGAGGALTYANLTERQLSRILQSFAPWMTLCEQTWSDLIPGGNLVRGNVEALLRTSTRERYEIHALAQSIGIETKAETRELEHRPPAPTDGPDDPEVDE